MSTQLEQVVENIKKAIRHEGFALLRKGVTAVTGSFKLWAERNV